MQEVRGNDDGLNTPPHNRQRERLSVFFFFFFSFSSLGCFCWGNPFWTCHLLERGEEGVE